MATEKNQRRGRAKVTAREMQNCAAKGTPEWSRKGHCPVLSVLVLEKRSLDDKNDEKELG